jgi:hypothetical protein
MRDGVLEVVWGNQPHRGGDGIYHVTFYVLPTAHRQAPLGSPRQQVSLHGEDAVRGFLWKDVLNEDAALRSRADAWMSELHDRGLLQLNPIYISDALFERFTVR